MLPPSGEEDPILQNRYIISPMLPISDPGEGEGAECEQGTGPDLRRPWEKPGNEGLLQSCALVSSLPHAVFFSFCSFLHCQGSHGLTHAMQASPPVSHYSLDLDTCCTDITSLFYSAPFPFSLLLK
jgi:hypothetical protein